MVLCGPDTCYFLNSKLAETYCQTAYVKHRVFDKCLTKGINKFLKMIKYGLKVLIVVFGLGIFTVASAARFDWVLGQSAVVDDGVVSDTTEQSRFDSVFGFPAIVYDSTVGAGTADVELFHYRFRDENGSEAAATAAASEDTALSNIIKGDVKRLRILLSNKGSASATNFQYQLEVSSSTCTSWLPVLKDGNISNGEHFKVVSTPYYSDNAVSTNVSSLLTDPASKTFVAGYLMGPSTTTASHTLTTTQFTELEFVLQPTSSAVTGVSYCFRVTNAGTATNFTYTVTPTVTLISNSIRGGGSTTEESGSGSTQTGGGASGGSGTESGGGGAPQGGGGSGGGSGVEALLSKKIFLAGVVNEALSFLQITLSKFLSLIS